MSPRECLYRAIQEPEVRMSAEQFAKLIANQRAGDGGFSRETLWAALEIACGEDDDDGS